MSLSPPYKLEKSKIKIKRCLNKLKYFNAISRANQLKAIKNAFPALIIIFKMIEPVQNIFNICEM